MFFWFDFNSVNEPWKLKSTDKNRCNTVIVVAINLVALLSQIAFPFMPNYSQNISEQVNKPIKKLTEFSIDLTEGHQIGVPQILVKKIDRPYYPFDYVHH